MATEQLKAMGDVGSISVILATISELLPSVAALVSIAWGLIRIYETRTVQRLLGNEKKHFVKYVKEEHSEDS